MPKPTIDNPSIKYLTVSRKGIPIYSWVKTYFTFGDKGNAKQHQDWSQEKP